MNRIYTYASVAPTFPQQYPKHDLVGVHGNPWTGYGAELPTFDYLKPLHHSEMERYGLEELPYQLARKRYLPLFETPAPIPVETLEDMRYWVSQTLSALADYHPLGDSPYGMYVGGDVGKNVKRSDVYRVFDTIPPWALEMVQELVNGTDPNEFTFLPTTNEIRQTAKELEKQGKAELFRKKWKRG